MVETNCMIEDIFIYISSVNVAPCSSCKSVLVDNIIYST
jgi:hypothetical protein